MKQSFLYDWMQLLSLECLIAIYCEGQPSLGGLASRGLGFVHNVMGINVVHNSMALGGGQNFPTVGLTGTELNAKGDYTMLN